MSLIEQFMLTIGVAVVLAVFLPSRRGGNINLPPDHQKPPAPLNSPLAP